MSTEPTPENKLGGTHTPSTSALAPEELVEIQELFPEMSDQQLRRFVNALDCTIDKILDGYFGLGEFSEKNYTKK